MSDYDGLERETAKPKRIKNHRVRWDSLEPVDSVNGRVRERIIEWCQHKNITLESLVALGARVNIPNNKSGAVELAFAGHDDTGAVTAIKYRAVGGSSHDSRAEPPSTWVRPIILGNRASLDWLIAEGESDAARLWILTEGRCAVMALPAGAPTFKAAWADVIARGARVALCHDADEAGDAGAAKAARHIGGMTLRLRPPVEDGDWCDWAGTAAEFAELAKQHRPTKSRLAWQPMRGMRRRRAEPYGGRLNIPTGTASVLTGRQGEGKSLLTAAEAAVLTQAGYAVAFIAEEDSIEATILPRLIAAGANLELCFWPEVVTRDDLGGIILPRDVDELVALAESLAGEHPLRMASVDPWTNHMGDLDIDKGAVRTALKPLIKAGRDYGFSPLLVAHPIKDTSSADPLTRIAHASALTQLVRSAFWLTPDPEGPERDNPWRLVAQVKENLTVRAATLRYRIDTRLLPETPDEPEDTVPVLLPDGESMLDWLGIHKLQRERSGNVREDTAWKTCRDWLIGWLREHEPVTRAHVIAAALQAGFTESTLERAKRPQDGLPSIVESTRKQREEAVWRLHPDCRAWLEGRESW
jgi:hypothetical protein